MGINDHKDLLPLSRNKSLFTLLKSGADLFKPHNDDEAAKLMTISLLRWKVLPLIVMQWRRLNA